MKWTTDTPTEPGWYWVRVSQYRETFVVRVRAPDDVYGRSSWIETPYGSTYAPGHPKVEGWQWSGPIPEPEEG